MYNDDEQRIIDVIDSAGALNFGVPNHLILPTNRQLRDGVSTPAPTRNAVYSNKKHAREITLVARALAGHWPIVIHSLAYHHDFSKFSSAGG